MRVKLDALGTAAGAVLEQQHKNIWHFVECFSKRLNDTKSKNGATECEILGCILAIERWYPYLLSKAFDVLTDRAPTLYIKTQ